MTVDRQSFKLRISAVLGRVVFLSLVLAIPLTAIPYGTAEEWWKALFICTVLALTILWLIDGLLSDSWISDGVSIILPIATLAVYSFLQTIQYSRPHVTPDAIALSPWTTISFDPYQTRFFAWQLIALMLFGLLLYQYVSSDNRLRLLIHVVLGVAVVSAVFGIMRQATQHSLGFGLPLLVPNQGYAQFINKNHFPFVMEMALGMVLGLLIGGGIRREHVVIYLAALIPIWAGFGMCGSRGGLLAMMAQVITATLVHGMALRNRDGGTVPSQFTRLLQSWPMRIVLVLALITCVTIGTLWLGGERLATRIEESSDQWTASAMQDRDRVNRRDIWQTTWKMFTANPLAGVGMGAYWIAVPTYHDASGRMTPQEAHNDYLELLASGGLIAAAIVIWFTVASLRRIRDNLQSQGLFHRAACLGSLIGLTGVMVHSLLDFGLHIMVNAVMFTTLIVIATSKPRHALRKAE